MHSHSNSHQALPALPSPPPSLLRSPRLGGCPRPHRLPAGETPTRWRAAVGRDCGNGGVLPRRPRLPRASPPQPQQRNPVWRAWAVLCLCELRHSPLREASADFKEHRLGLRFQCCHRVSQPTPKPLPQKLPDFSSLSPPRAKKGYKPSWLAWLCQWCRRSPGVSSSGTP